MSTQEFYIRGPTDTDARGPFTVEQLVTLGETGGIDAETLFYDAATEQWAPICHQRKVKNLVFPEKEAAEHQTQAACRDAQCAAGGAPADHGPQMLAAAEGRTDDTKDKRTYMETQARSARAGLVATTLILPVQRRVLDRAAHRHRHESGLCRHAQYPLIFLGVLDLVCAVLLALGTVAMYPFVRFRAAFGIGFLGLLYALQDQP